MASKRVPNWQLPPGVSRPTWDYIQSEHIASEYDAYFADSQLMRLDLQVLGQHLPGLGQDPPPVIADLGCGTGRVARQLLPLGYRLINVDLSPAMLRELAAKTPAEFQDRCECICANLVELDAAVPPHSVDLAVCLFSSLGMIRGRVNRKRCLRATHTILKPGGRLLVHVHNRLHSLFDPGGPSWLLKSFIRSWLRGEQEFGDRVYAYRRLPQMFLHIYSRRELVADLRAAGFSHWSIDAISATGDRLLPRSTPMLSLRAGGYFALASK